MKALVLLLTILTILVGVSFETQIKSNYPKDFLAGFLSVIKGREAAIKEECLGKEFEKDVGTVLDSLEKEDFLQLALTSDKIIQNLHKYCTDEDMDKVFEDAHTMLKNGKFFKNMIVHKEDIFHTLEECLGKAEINSRILGETFGKLIKIIVYDTSHNKPKILNFLAEEAEKYHSFSEEDVEKFVDGFFEGVSSVPPEKNKCVHDISNVKDEIISSFAHLINAIKTRQHIIEAFTEIYELLNHFTNLDANCRFHSLSKDILDLSTKIGITKAAFRVTTHFISVIEDLQGLYKNFLIKEFKKSGINLGSFTKIVLNYSTI